MNTESRSPSRIEGGTLSPVVNTTGSPARLDRTKTKKCRRVATMANSDQNNSNVLLNIQPVAPHALAA